MLLLVLCLVRLLRLLRWLLVSLSPSACESGYAMRAHNLNRLTDRVCKSCCGRGTARKNRPRQPQLN